MTERQIAAIEARVRELEAEADAIVSSAPSRDLRLVAYTLAELARAMRAVQDGTS